MRHPYHRKYRGARGEIRRIWHDSPILAENRLGDPSYRACDLYLPHGVSPQGLPLLVCLAAFGKSGLAHTNWQGEKENIPERLDRLIGQGQMPPVVVAFPDCYSSMGGSQYVDSPVLGRFASYLIQEILPLIERETGAGGEGKRGLFGHSSGGYGALYHALYFPEIWSGIAAHAPDCAFDLVYLPDWPGKLTLLAGYESIPDFITQFHETLKSNWPQAHLMMLLAMAASYDPVADTPETPLGFRLPLDRDTAEIIPEAWQNWLRHDPLHMIEGRASALKQMKALWLDVGRCDQFHLHYGCRRLSRMLRERDIPHIYEEFDDDHSGIDYRLDHSLPWLAQKLTG